MPAAVYVGDGRIEVEEVPVRSPGPGEVLVEIAECGICGSDLHMVMERYARPGAILGHEWSGIVAAAPDRLGLVSRRPGGGKRRPGVRHVPALPAGPPVGVPAPCRGGLRRVPGGVLPVQDGRGRRADPDPRFACRRGRPHWPSRWRSPCTHCGWPTWAPMTGCSSPAPGPVGLLIVAVLRAQGISDITVSEPSPVRRRQALDVGATRVVSTRRARGAAHGAAGGGALRRRLRVLGARQRGRGRPSASWTTPARWSSSGPDSNRPASTRTA